jgi:hypothetical protein
MLLRHKQTGDVYVYHKVLMDSGEYDIYEEPKPAVVVSEQPEMKKARRKKVAIQTDGETNGTDTE